MKKIIIGFLILFAVAACTVANANIENVGFNSLKKSIDKKEDFILEIMQDGCSYCTDFAPKFQAALKEANLTAKSINLSKISQQEYNDLKKLLSISNLGTPTVLFFKKGVETSSLKRIVGSHDKDYVLEKFKSNGFIK